MIEIDLAISGVMLAIYYRRMPRVTEVEIGSQAFSINEPIAEDSDYKELIISEPISTDSDLNLILPEETLLHVFQHLDSKELALVRLVCKDWLRIAQDRSFVQPILEAHDWREENPHFERACYALHCLRNIKKPKLIVRDKDTYISRSIFSGNHWIFADHLRNCDQKVMVQVWSVNSKLEKEPLYLRCERVFENASIANTVCYGEKIYMPLFNTNNILIWDLNTDTVNTWNDIHSYEEKIIINHNRIITRTDNEYKFWNRSDLKLIDIKIAQDNKFAIIDDILYKIPINYRLLHRLTYKNILVFLNKDTALNKNIFNQNKQKNFYKIIIYDPKTRNEEVIFKIASTTKTIDYMCINGHLLHVQVTTYSLFRNINTLIRYDLKKKKWLHKIDLNNTKLEGAFAGHIITSTREKWKIWDYR